MGNIYKFLNEVPNQCVHVFYESCIINYSLSIELHIDIFSKLRKALHIFSKLQIGPYNFWVALIVQMWVDFPQFNLFCHKIQKI